MSGFVADVVWKLLERTARLADAYFEGVSAARRRWRETQRETHARHAAEDAAWKAQKG